MTKSMTTIEAKEKFVELINHIIHTKERVILTRRDNEVAAIVSLEDLRWLEAKQDKEDLEEAIDAFKEAKNQGTISLESLKDEIHST